MDAFTDKVIHGNCIDIMGNMPDGSIDLTVTSPPYDNLRTYGKDIDKVWCADIWQQIISQLYRITKDGGVAVWVVGDAAIKGSETGTSFRQALYAMECGFRLHDTMIYQKNGSSYPDTVRYYQCWEYMFILSKGKPGVINRIADRKNKWQGTWGQKSHRGQDGNMTKGEKAIYREYGVRFNIWKYNTGYGFSASDDIAHQHPAIFPEQLAIDHVKSWSNEGNIVFDPMCGSGTTLLAAEQLGRHWIGIDINEDYCALARERIELEKQQLKLF